MNMPEEEELNVSTRIRHPLHPAIVHFPITLFPLSTLFMILWYWAGHNAFFLHAAFWAFLLGALMVIPVGLTGVMDRAHTEVDDVEGQRLISAHTSMGILTFVVSVFSGFYFLLNKPMVYVGLIPAFTAVSLLLSIMVFLQGTTGGLMVYSHLMGVKGHMRS